MHSGDDIFQRGDTKSRNIYSQDVLDRACGRERVFWDNAVYIMPILAYYEEFRSIARFVWRSSYAVLIFFFSRIQHVWSVSCGRSMCLISLNLGLKHIHHPPAFAFDCMSRVTTLTSVDSAVLTMKIY